MTAEEKEVKAVCDAWGQAMQAMDFGAHDALWDRDYEHFVYQPEEFERPCRTWDEFQKYLAYIPTAVTNESISVLANDCLSCVRPAITTTTVPST